MATTAGLLTQVSVTSTTANLSSAVATGGTAPYTYQWYRSTTSSFSPGAGNIIAGATSLTLADTGLIPNTLYYYKVVATDSGSVAGTSAQLAVTTAAPVLNPNQFAQTPYVGTIDMRFDYDTISVMIDASQATALYAGSAVKMVDSADGVPKVVSCSANTDEVLGFINFDIKTVQFLAGAAAEISMSGNVIYLYATAAVARGAQLMVDLATQGGVITATGGGKFIGWAFDKATAAGQLIRVKLVTPSFTTVA